MDIFCLFHVAFSSIFLFFCEFSTETERIEKAERLQESTAPGGSHCEAICIEESALCPVMTIVVGTSISPAGSHCEAISVEIRVTPSISSSGFSLRSNLCRNQSYPKHQPSGFSLRNNLCRNQSYSKHQPQRVLTAKQSLRNQSYSKHQPQRGDISVEIRVTPSISPSGFSLRSNLCRNQSYSKHQPQRGDISVEIRVTPSISPSGATFV